MNSKQSEVYKQRMGAEYVEKYKGSRCPFCLGSDFEGDSVDIETGTVSQRIRCNECNSVWYDIYTLAWYEVDPNEVGESALELRQKQEK